MLFGSPGWIRTSDRSINSGDQRRTVVAYDGPRGPIIVRFFLDKYPKTIRMLAHERL
jgi:hypothetical protein